MAERIALPVAHLARQLHENLEQGGPRKVSVLRALAKHWGYTARQFDLARAILKDAKRIKFHSCYGGGRYRAC